MNDSIAPIPFRVPADHPSLIGHFPGNPVTPGVVLLDIVRRAAEEHAPGVSWAGVKQVKFLRTVLPEQACELHLSRKGDDRMAFRIEHNGELAASGTLIAADGA